ncbi:MAG TPA: hypothetical protein VLT88_05205, partial [Desulfosarcina sp.]|nr:hypothetical protein [Desulfosarcina sp.]
DLEAAEKVLQDAAQAFPAQGVVFNNLAQVLMDQGRKDEALHAARRAVALGGPLKAQFEATLEEIRSR